MEAVSQLILRNLEALGEGPVLLVDMPADGLANHVATSGHAVRTSSQAYGAYRALEAEGLEARFEPAPAARGDERTVILRLPREKDRLALVLHALAASMDAGARLWLAGENRAGIKSAPRLLESRFEHVGKRDNARHCGLLEARSPRPGPPFELDAYVARGRVTIGGQERTLHSLPGVFAHGRVDAGTALLLEALEDLPVAGEVLDFACGNGVVAIALAGRVEPPRLTLLDHSALALESARRSLAANGLEGRLVASDGLGDLTGSYDWIVTNPPFHSGVDQDLDIVSGFFRQAGTFLKRNGRIVVVFNRHLPYERWARDRFRFVNRLAESRDYIVIQASRTE